MSESEKQNLPYEPNGSKAMQLDVGITDMIATKEIAHDIWNKEYAPFLFEETGVLSFKLYSTCNCKLDVSLRIGKDGLGANTDEKRCDLCLKEKRTHNFKRMNSIMDGLHSYVDEWVDSNWDKFAEIVLRVSGRDLKKEGISSATTMNVKNVLGTAQMLAKMVDQLLDWVDVARLSSGEKRSYRSMISAFDDIRGQEFMKATEINASEGMAKEIADELNEAGERGEIRNEQDFINKIEGLLEEKARKLNESEDENGE